MNLKANIKRLLQYRQSLIHLRELGFNRVFSYNLANEAGVSAEQVRKDFSLFGIKGNKKAGYDIDEVLEGVNTIFQKNEDKNVILVGMGNLGTALINYKGFSENRLIIKAAFDIDPSKQKKASRVPVYPLEMIPEFIYQHKVKIAILAVPQVAAQRVTDILVISGIRGILNFCPVNLMVPETVFVRYVNLSNALESLVYYTSKQ